MNTLFSAGGTLGHIYPAVTLMNKYIETYPNDKIFFLANKKDQQYIDKIILPSQVELIFLESYGFSKSVVKIIKALIVNLKTYYKIRRIINKNKIQLVFGMGGYISGITIKAAKKEKAKTIIHEQNSVIGLANKLSLRYTDLLLTTFRMKKMHSNQYEVGNPRYYEALKYSSNPLKSKYNILILSGTLGAKVINQVAVEFLQSSESHRFTITLITGKRYYDEIIKTTSLMPHFQILPFSNEVLKLISQSGIVISRAGSSTIFEILGAHSIPILIPSPNVTKNHQYYNAKAIIDEGIGYMIDEKNFNKKTMISVIEKAFNNYDKMITAINQYSLKYKKDNFFMHIDEIEGKIKING